MGEEKNGINLLVVDDEIVTTEVLRDQIDRKSLGIGRIYIAYNTEMAREILRGTEAEIVLCDIEMPKENGLEFLKWVREERIETEFLFLTSHEKFEYAFGAVKGGAANYLLKPLDMPGINRALWAAIEKVNRKKRIRTDEEHWTYGKRKILQKFWWNVVRGSWEENSEAAIRKEMEMLGLSPDTRKKYRLVLLNARKEAIFMDSRQETLNRFIIDNILAETFTSGMNMEKIVHWEDGENYYVAVVSDLGREQIREKMDRMEVLLNQFLDKPIYAGYISEPAVIVELERVCRKVLAYDKKHMHDEGEIVFLSEVKAAPYKLEKLLDPHFIQRCLEKGERVQLLEYLQKLVARVKKKDNSLANMNYLQMDLIQIFSVYLHKQGLDLECLFEDDQYLEIQKKAFTSELAMIRWNAYVVNKIFDCTRCGEHGDGMVDIVVKYIHDHYEENVTRNTLAEIVHFTPEYVGKAFKKKTGCSINDYVNKLRIEKAKHMLKTTNYKVTDIALMVGFENMPYFSSVFKKYEGVSPAEFKKRM